MSESLPRISSEIWKKVRRIQIRTARAVTDGFAGAYHSAFKGRGMQFEDVREYQPGDDVRALDWNVTARMDYPYIKSFREERELTVMLVVDVSASSLVGSRGVQKRERIAELAAVLTLSAMRNCDKVGLLLFTDRVETYLPPKRGTSQMLKLIRELLTARPVGSGTDVGGALEELARLQRRRGVCFLISDFIGPPCEREVTLASRRYDLTVLCVTDPLELDFPDLGLVTVRDLEGGGMRVVDTSSKAVRQQLADQTQLRIDSTRQLSRRTGVGFVDVRTDQDYLSALQRSFEQREKRSR